MKTLNRLIYKFINKHFLDGCSDYNSLNVRKSCRTKLQAREAFAEHNIPHAAGQLFFNPFLAVRFVKKYVTKKNNNIIKIPNQYLFELFFRGVEV